VGFEIVDFSNIGGWSSRRIEADFYTIVTIFAAASPEEEVACANRGDGLVRGPSTCVPKDGLAREHFWRSSLPFLG
jgi:hypothetical protein